VFILVIAGSLFLAYRNLLFVENYIIKKDIGGLKNTTSVLDIDGGCRTDKKPCFWYSAQYRLSLSDTGSFAVNVYVEQQFLPIRENSFLSEIKDKYFVVNPQKINQDGNYIYQGEDKYGLSVTSWISGSKLIILRSYVNIHSQYQDDSDRIVSEYFNKYPSSIK